MPIKRWRGDFDAKLSTLGDCTHSGLAGFARMREVAAAKRHRQSQ